MLAIDLDPQGNLSDYFDVPPDAEPTIADVLAGRAKARRGDPRRRDPGQPDAGRGRADARRQDGPRADAAPRARQAAATTTTLILIDCPPALGLLTVNALVAADHALLSAEAQYFALQGVEQALEVIELARESLNPELSSGSAWC